ncbi:MAG: SurA N-terminal domain-containing protein [Myxococcaceae bacterium]
MRRNSNSWLFVLIFAIITFVFAISLGISGVNVSGEQKYAADVNGHVITFQEFQMAYATQVKMIQSVSPDFNPEGPIAETLKKTVLDRLIAKVLLNQLAAKQKFSISDQELATFLRTQIFDKDKGLDRETYKRAIYSNYHMSENQFENQLRQDLLAEKMTNLLETAGPIASYIEFLKKNANIKT